MNEEDSLIVQCKNCGWEGLEYNMIFVRSDKNDNFVKSCPICLTNKFIIDIDGDSDLKKT